MKQFLNFIKSYSTEPLLEEDLEVLLLGMMKMYIFMRVVVT